MVEPSANGPTCNLTRRGRNLGCRRCVATGKQRTFAVELKSKVVFLVEGEKDCDALWRIGLVSTCNPGGAGKWKPEWSEMLRGRDVVILPDNDEPGELHAWTVARALTGIANSVTILRLPGLPPKGDVTDYLKAGGTADELLRLAEVASIRLARGILRAGLQTKQTKAALDALERIG